LLLSVAVVGLVRWWRPSARSLALPVRSRSCVPPISAVSSMLA